MKTMHHYLHTIKKSFLLSALCILVLVVLLLVAAWWLIQDIQQVQLSGGLHPMHHAMQEPNHVPNITSIAPWMTFEYINVIFKLPSDYLKNTLQINDAAYPKIEIERYARLHGVNQLDVVHDVQNALAEYKK